MAVPKRDFDHRDYFLVETFRGSISKVLASHPQWKYEYGARSSERYHVFSVEKGQMVRVVKRDDSIDDAVNSVHHLPPKRLFHRAPIPIAESGSSSSDKPTDSSQLVVEKAREEFGINDPGFSDQWHILNTQFPGDDVNVLPIWRQNITGHGVITAIIDDGLDMDNPDLKDSFCPEGSWDFNDNTALPKPRLSDDYHGTRCAGEISAAKGNDFCGVGVAFDSKVSGIRILSGQITSEDEAAAMVYALDVNDIYSCSWGPPDNGKSMDVPDKIVREAILRGVQEGREGKGALYVFASGNGASHGDSCNFDGYTNSIYSITVTAIDHKGLHPSYAESCAAVMVSTYSSGSGEHIHTTDFHEGCSARHGGTSAAAPLAAGLYALVLEANPDLTWRDIQYLTVLSAVEVDSSSSNWQDSAIPGKRYSYRYGWGKFDAAKMVEMARTNYTLLKPQAWYYMPYTRLPLDKKSSKRSPVLLNSHSSNENPEGVTYSSTFYISPEVMDKTNLDHIEQLTVTVNIDSTKRGVVYVRLISPHNIISRLAQQRTHDLDKAGFRDWTFSSVAHWGEDPVGNWTLEVTNTEADKEEVRFNAWQLKLFGESVDASKAVKYDIDDDYSTINDEEDHQASDIGVQSSTIASGSDLPATSSVESSGLISASSTASPASSEYTHHMVKTHTELYFLSFLIIGFIICLCLLKNRRTPGRARRRDDYEFDIINPEDEDSDFDHNSRINDVQGVLPEDRSLGDVVFSIDDEEVDNGTKTQGSTNDTSNEYMQDPHDVDVGFNKENQERERLFQTSEDEGTEEGEESDGDPFDDSNAFSST
ncbi:hypothetical protein FOA43_004608 [Brettanomyces nanus]|uniref:P/Homo B domain-containing protein n=1 Tax=Eeniella nana TaxID=13502 RepID=A0A875S6I7_EENNA|nr:uncharacterized protein FOA43_004608 [Brettanomyces nanus]QPG77201.1 hypothetical protein FOA43_004608 [Brettanomyces nanus]